MMPTTLERTLRTIAIRHVAIRLVGPCSDVQIMMVASVAKQVVTMAARLEDLDDQDLETLYVWMQNQ